MRRTFVIPSWIRPVAVATSLMVFATYCSSDSLVVPPDNTVVSVTLNPVTATLRVGETAQLTAVGSNKIGVPITGGVQFASSDASIANVSSVGFVRGLKPGTATITASAGSVQKTAVITVTPGLPSSITKTAGDAQFAAVNTAVPIAPAVQVKDSAGNAIAGATVTFAVASGGGSIAGGAATTNAAGVATLGAWVLGPQTGVNTLVVTVLPATSAIAVTFTATATPRIPGPPASITINNGNTQTATAGRALPLPLSVIVREANGLPLANIPVTFAATPGNGAIAGASVVTDANGVATSGLWTLGAAVGAQTATATVANLAPVTFTATATPVPLPATQLAVNRAAASGAVTVPFGTQPIIELRDVNNTVSVIATDAVTATISAGGRLTGSITVNAVAGIATFTDLTPLDAGTFTLTYSAPGLTPVSQQVTVLGAPNGPPAALALSTSPSGGTTATPLSTQPVVEIRDAANLRSGNATNAVTVAVASGPGTLSGTTTVNAVNGVASFTNLQLSAAGTYTLTFTSSGLTSVTSVPFTVATAPAVQIAIATQPVGSTSGALLATQPVLNLRDAAGITATTANGPVTATLIGGTGVLSGTTTVNAVNGVATFTDLRITGAGNSSIVFSSPGLPNTTSQVITTAP